MNEVEFENTLRMFRPKLLVRKLYNTTPQSRLATPLFTRHAATIAASACGFLLGIAFAYTFLFPKSGVETAASMSPQVVYVMPTSEQLDAMRSPSDLLACRLVTVTAVPTIPQPVILSAIRSLEHDEWR